jgi:hypothetical protein
MNEQAVGEHLMKIANLQVSGMACQPKFSQFCINPSSLLLEFNFCTSQKGKVHSRTGHEGPEKGAEV